MWAPMRIKSAKHAKNTQAIQVCYIFQLKLLYILMFVSTAADMSGENSTVVAAALKLYLRDLNDPIVPTILFDKIAAALSMYLVAYI